ncbi:MAG: 23S rRNA (pseudouridine(1915)-N(3))-methyltransferase RlmH [Flavobacteriales bacterium]|nr:23S rRNA (pseudouridine(1915)-N(3))-methyltransferase RlmH [Flavobacteriales bacterium]
MKIKLITIGKTDEEYLQLGITKYINRLKHYVSFEILSLNDVKIGSKPDFKIQKEKEGKMVLDKIQQSDVVVLLDEKGKSLSSILFADFIQKKMNSIPSMVFVIGGPFGFSEEVYQRANYKVSLSAMTFSHQMIRLLFVEQLYRAFTIIRGEKYHHE